MLTPNHACAGAFRTETQLLAVEVAEKVIWHLKLRIRIDAKGAYTGSWSAHDAEEWLKNHGPIQTLRLESDEDDSSVVCRPDRWEINSRRMGKVEPVQFENSQMRFHLIMQSCGCYQPALS